MIPLQLTLKGFYSYLEETVIDFRPLTAAGLFGIFGQVGSGKSSIVDAIGFALYDQSERLNRQEKRHYMHLSAREMIVDFTFLHGDGEYRFLVSGKRSGKGTRPRTTTAPPIGGRERHGFPLPMIGIGGQGMLRSCWASAMKIFGVRWLSPKAPFRSFSGFRARTGRRCFRSFFSWIVSTSTGP